MNINKIDDEKLKKLALIEYPEDTSKDTDGDWYDKNVHLRNAFIVGFTTAQYISALD